MSHITVSDEFLLWSRCVSLVCFFLCIAPDRYPDRDNSILRLADLENISAHKDFGIALLSYGMTRFDCSERLLTTITAIHPWIRLRSL